MYYKTENYNDYINKVNLIIRTYRSYKKRIQDTKSKVISYNYNSNKSGNSFKSRISSQFMGNKDSNGNTTIGVWSKLLRN